MLAESVGSAGVQKDASPEIAIAVSVLIIPPLYQGSATMSPSGSLPISWSVPTASASLGLLPVSMRPAQDSVRSTDGDKAHEP